MLTVSHVCFHTPFAMQQSLAKLCQQQCVSLVYCQCTIVACTCVVDTMLVYCQYLYKPLASLMNTARLHMQAECDATLPPCIAEQ